LSPGVEVEAMRQEARLLTIDEAAKALSLSKATVYRLAQRGLLKTVTVGRARRIALADLEAFVEQLRRAGESEVHDVAR